MGKNILLAISWIAGPLNLLAVNVDDFDARTYTDPSGNLIPYRLYVPHKYDPLESYPLVVFLHGAGPEAGTDNRNQLVRWPAPMIFAEARNQEKYPCFMIAPQIDLGRSWQEEINMRLVDEIIDSILKEYSGVDETRIYLTGVSDGGVATLTAAKTLPGRFAAGVPIGAFVDFEKNTEIIDWPFWAFGGGGTRTGVELRSLVERVRDMGGDPRFTMYPNIGSLIWNPGVYAEPELIPWLFQFRTNASPPAIPESLQAAAVSHRQVRLEWNIDSDGVVLEYHVYRDGVRIARVKGREFGVPPPTGYDDFSVAEERSYTYQVVALSMGNVRSDPSLIVSVSTPKDSIPPEVVWVGGGRAEIKVVFDEKVEESSAGDPENYSVLHPEGGEINVVSATLTEGETSVLLKLDPPAPLGRRLSLTVKSVRDQSRDRNGIAKAGATYPFDNIPHEGLAFWLRSDKGLVVDGDGEIIHYAEHSEQGLARLLRVPEQRPIVLASSQNQRPVIGFDGIRHFLPITGDLADFTDGITAIIIANPGGRNSSEQLFDFGTAGANQGSMELGARPSNNIRFGRGGVSSDLEYQVYDGTESGGRVIGLAEWQPGRLRVYSVTQQGGTEGEVTNVALYADGGVVGRGEVRIPRLRIRSNNYVGRMNPSDVSLVDGMFQGEIGEFLLFNRALDKADRQEIEQYLIRKYHSVGNSNRSPAVSVYPVEDLRLPSTDDSVRTTVRGVITDDDLPLGRELLTEWSQVGGPGPVTFDQPNAVVTNAEFASSGDYVLRFAGSDGELESFVDLSVRVLPVDRTPPEIVLSTAHGRSDRILITFSEPVNRETAENPSNYWVDHEVEVFSAGLLSDQRRVVLSVSPLKEHVEYKVDAMGVLDLAPVPNVSASTATFSYVRRFLFDDFSAGNLDQWSVIDEGTTQESSVWRIVWGELRESSSIGSFDPYDDGRLGTFIYYDDEAALEWREYEINVLVRSEDDDGVGVLVYYSDPNNYLRFEMDQQRNFRKLIQKVDGIVTLLAQEEGSYTVGKKHLLTIRVNGRNVSVSLDDAILFGGSVASETLTQGTVGLYAWRNAEVYYDNVVVKFIGRALVANNLVDKGFLSTDLGQRSGGSSQVFDDGSWDTTGYGVGLDGVSGAVPSLAQYSVDGSSVLSFSEGFNDLVEPHLHGQNDWLTSGTPEPVLQGETVLEGTQSLEINAAREGGPVSATKRFSAVNATEVWSDLYVKPVSTPDSILPALDPDTAAAILFDEDGKLRIFDGGSLAWATVHSSPAVSFEEWERLTVYKNYERQLWTLWLNGERVVQEIPFANSTPSFRKIKVSSESVFPTFVDKIEVGETPPPGLNRDDEGYFEFQMVRGEFDLIVRVADLTGDDPAGRAGLMMRESTGGRDRFVSILATPGNRYVFARRLDSDRSASLSMLPNHSSFPNVWLRISRDDDKILLFTSEDGEIWSEQEAIELSDLSNELKLGLFVSSGNFSAKAAVATFTDFRLTSHASQEEAKQ